MNKEATKKQLWLLYCLTRQDWRGKNLTKTEASKIISETIKQKQKEKEEAKKEIEEAIESIKKNFYEKFEELKRIKQNIVVIEEDKAICGDKAKIYIEKNFFLCGAVNICIKDKDFIKKYKKVSKKTNDKYEYGDSYIYKNTYDRRYYLVIKGITQYYNRTFELAEEALEFALAQQKFNLYCYSVLD
ncbi:MAG: hypothetical protein RMI01_09695 [Thermodesulfovibrio sp.]|nr:hypothetical protein [Thermodesulfovibrio sp.]